jgi:hypothetical protein
MSVTDYEQVTLPAGCRHRETSCTANTWNTYHNLTDGWVEQSARIDGDGPLVVWKTGRVDGAAIVVWPPQRPETN